MPKINIYVPDDLKARMDQVSDPPNWSAICQAAIRAELKEVEKYGYSPIARQCAIESLAKEFDKLINGLKEIERKYNAQREEVAAAAEKFESHKALFFSVSRNDGTEA